MSLDVDASVAIVQLRQSALSDRKIFSPHDYDVIVLDEPSKPSTSYSKGIDNYHVRQRSTVGTHAVGQTVITLPTIRVKNGNVSLSESVLAELFIKTRIQFRRVVNIPFWNEMSPAPLNLNCTTAFVCAPLIAKEHIQYPYGRLENLGRLVNMCMNEPDKLDIQTRHMLQQLDHWISESQVRNPHFLASLFVLTPAYNRILRCSHNPIYKEEKEDRCVRHIYGPTAGSVRSVCSSIDLDENVKIENMMRAAMIEYDKCDKLVLNSQFGWPYEGVQQVPCYYHPNLFAQRRSNEDQEKLYPIHSAVYANDMEKLKTLVRQGVDVNKADLSTWTPLHLALFHQRKEAAAFLISVGNADVNKQNKAGATPLHMAARQGDVYMVELLLCHPHLNTEIRNNEGKTAYDLICKEKPLKEQKIIANMLAQRPMKIKVDFVGAVGNAMVTMKNAKDTTIGDLMAEIEKELNISQRNMKLFALWAVSESASVQLMDHHKVREQLHEKRWQKRVAEWTNQDQSNEVPRLVMKRRVRVNLEREMQQIDNLSQENEIARNLLYAEALQNYLQGFYPAESTPDLASNLYRILHSTSDSIPSNFDLSKIFPAYLIGSDNMKRVLKETNKKLKTQQRANIAKLELLFLKTCWQFTCYGATFYPAEYYRERPTCDHEKIFCGVNDYGIHIIAQNSHKFSTYWHKNYRYTSIPERSAIEIIHDRNTKLYIVSPMAQLLSMLIKKLREDALGEKA